MSAVSREKISGDGGLAFFVSSVQGDQAAARSQDAIGKFEQIDGLRVVQIVKYPGGDHDVELLSPYGVRLDSVTQESRAVAIFSFRSLYVSRAYIKAHIAELGEEI